MSTMGKSVLARKCTVSRLSRLYLLLCKLEAERKRNVKPRTKPAHQPTNQDQYAMRSRMPHAPYTSLPLPWADPSGSQSGSTARTTIASPTVLALFLGTRSPT